ncbi:MAG TPA: hypothetical protein VIM56_02550 [Rhizomicrobium sp.]
MKVLLICGPYGSGTSAVAGMLANLGATGLGPYWQTNDPRTPNSHELIALKDMLLELVSEDTSLLKPDAPVDRALADFKTLLAARVPDGRPVFLKHPAAALILPQFCRVFDTQLIYVLRSMQEIEATRQRRNWRVGGAQAAQIIYSRMFEYLVNGSTPTMILRYRNLIDQPLDHARSLAAYANLPRDERALQHAASIIVPR